jgi:hypothetical protein
MILSNDRGALHPLIHLDLLSDKAMSKETGGSSSSS